MDQPTIPPLPWPPPFDGTYPHPEGRPKVMDFREKCGSLAGDADKAKAEGKAAQ